jgi:uncharacterized membrane protein
LIINRRNKFALVQEGERKIAAAAAILLQFLSLLPAKSGAVSRMIARSLATASLAIAEMMNLHSLNLSIVEPLS